MERPVTSTIPRRSLGRPIRPDSSCIGCGRAFAVSLRESTRLRRISSSPRCARSSTPSPAIRSISNSRSCFRLPNGAGSTSIMPCFPLPMRCPHPRGARMAAPSSFDYERRGHGQARVIEVDGQTGAPKAAITEEAKTFVYADRRYRHDVGDDAREIVWISERDGWRHLYLADTATGTLKQITRGPWVVRDVLKVDDAQRRIWFSASGMDAVRIRISNTCSASTSTAPISLD